jgi:hypothetical protein
MGAQRNARRIEAGAEIGYDQIKQTPYATAT